MRTFTGDAGITSESETRAETIYSGWVTLFSLNHSWFISPRKITPAELEGKFVYINFQGKFNMKKGIIASVIALAMSAGAAHANTGNPDGTVKFTGVVTGPTCPVKVFVAGAELGNDFILLPTVAPRVTAQTAVDFALKGDATQPGCDAASLNGKTIEVSWSPNQLGLDGVKTTTDATVLLTAVNTTTATKDIKESNTKVDFDAPKLVTDGLQFSAKPKGGSTSGRYNAEASFWVAYK